MIDFFLLPLCLFFPLPSSFSFPSCLGGGYCRPSNTSLRRMKVIKTLFVNGLPGMDEARAWTKPANQRTFVGRTPAREEGGGLRPNKTLWHLSTLQPRDNAIKQCTSPSINQHVHLTTASHTQGDEWHLLDAWIERELGGLGRVSRMLLGSRLDPHPRPHLGSPGSLTWSW